MSSLEMSNFESLSFFKTNSDSTSRFSAKFRFGMEMEEMSIVVVIGVGDTGVIICRGRKLCEWDGLKVLLMGTGCLTTQLSKFNQYEPEILLLLLFGSSE